MLYDHGPVRPPEGSAPYMFPPIGYSGFSVTGTFQLPFSTNLVGTEANPVVWSVEDPSIASITPASAPENYDDFGATWVLVGTLKPGTTKIIAKLGNDTVEATLVVAEYTTAQMNAGIKRYYDPANPSPQRVACATCHESLQGADHSPLEMEGFTDEDILQAVTDGKYQDGYVLQNVDHRWELTDEERAGIVPYLRSLQPKGFF